MDVNQIELYLFKKKYILTDDLFGEFIHIKKDYYMQISLPAIAKGKYALTLFRKRQGIYTYGVHFELTFWNARQIGRDLESCIKYEIEKEKKGIKGFGIYRL